MNERKGFVFFRSYWEGLKQFDPEVRFKFYECIFRYVFEDKEPVQLDKMERFMFEQIKPTIDKGLLKYDTNVSNGKKGGRPKKGHKKVADDVENEKPKETQNNPNKPSKTQEKDEDDETDETDNNPNKPKITQNNPTKTNKKEKEKDKDKENKKDKDKNSLVDSAEASSTSDSENEPVEGKPDDEGREPGEVIAEKKKTVTQTQRIKDEFERLWKMYPRKEGPKKRALKAYSDARKKGVTFADVEAGIKRYADMLMRTETPKRFTKMGSAWFYEELWTNEYDDSEGPLVAPAEERRWDDETI